MSNRQCLEYACISVIVLLLVSVGFLTPTIEVFIAQYSIPAMVVLAIALRIYSGKGDQS